MTDFLTSRLYPDEGTAVLVVRSDVFIVLSGSKQRLPPILLMLPWLLSSIERNHGSPPPARSTDQY